MSENNLIGKYRLVKEIGKGGFGTVYLVHDVVLDVERALKVLHPALLADEVFIARFKQEAQFSARLDHPNVVPVYDFGEASGRFFLAMKYMPGGSLKDRLDQNGPLDEETAITMLEQIARGMAYIHAHGIVHRDLKPRNILFDEDEAARISDMGFAKSLSGSDSTNLSASGMIMGTPAYMAPEIWRAKKATPASDVYSLGCVFYEMLTGKILFDGDSPAEVMTKHIIDGPTFEPGVAEKYRPILKAVLNRDPEKRVVDLSEFVFRVKQLKKGSVATGEESGKSAVDFDSGETIPALYLPSDEALLSQKGSEDSAKGSRDETVLMPAPLGLKHEPSAEETAIFTPPVISEPARTQSKEMPVNEDIALPPVPPTGTKFGDWFSRVPLYAKIIAGLIVLALVVIGLLGLDAGISHLAATPTFTLAPTLTDTPYYTKLPTQLPTATFTPTLTKTPLPTFTLTATRVIPSKTPVPTDTPVPPSNPVKPTQPSGPVLIVP